VIERLPDVGVIIAPIGAGSGACGHCLGAKAINPRIRVVGVQAEGAPVVHRAFHERRLVSIDRVTTFADGLATRQAYELPVSILWRLLDDLVLVSDTEMRRAIRLLYEAAHQVAEPAGPRRHRRCPQVSGGGARPTGGAGGQWGQPAGATAARDPERGVRRSGRGC